MPGDPAGRQAGSISDWIGGPHSLSRAIPIALPLAGANGFFNPTRLTGCNAAASKSNWTIGVV
jgi:hypothetical protein